ncbi:MAG: nitrate reductase molybdenum cofactor assembly chaperone [Burkholderiaceae bacterium]
MKPMKYSLRALARMLAYPDAAWHDQAGALIEAIDGEGVLGASRRAELRAVVDQMRAMDDLDAESRYVATFDRGHATSLHLFEHVHGDSRDRGPAMIDLAQTYRRAGLRLAANELPDHLGALLEFASTQPPGLARAFLGEIAHLLNRVFSALQSRGSPYAAVIAAVIELAGQRAQAVEIEADRPIDESWSEPQAFAGCSLNGQAKPGEPRPIHVMRGATQARRPAA